MKTEQNTAAIYIRRSATDRRDADDSDNRSLISQERDCRQWAEREGLTVTHVYREAVGTSASHLTNHRRPQMERALSDMGSSYSTLIVWAFDRATRKGIAEAGMILDRVDTVGGRLVSVTDGIDTDDPTARLIIAIRSEMARDEMTKMSARITRGKEEQRRRGEHQGGRLPFGLMRDPSAPYGVCVNEEAADTIRRAATLIVEGAGLRFTCRVLNEKGRRTGNGRLWTPSALCRVLRRPHLRGRRAYGDDVFRGEDGTPVQVSEPILTEAEFRRVDKTLLGRRRFTNRMKPGQTTVGAPTSLLGGLMRCSKCDTGMGHVRNTCTPREKSYHYRYYSCRVCTAPLHRVTAPASEDYITRCALNFLASLDPDSAIIEEIGLRWLARLSPEQVGRHEEIVDEIEVVEGRLRDLQTEFYEGRSMEVSVYERLNRNLSDEVDVLRNELTSTPPPQANLGPLFDLVACADDPDSDIIGPGSPWGNLEEHVRKVIIRVLVDEVAVEKRDQSCDDIEGRISIRFATESNVTRLADRSEPLRGKHITLAVNTA